MNPELRRVWVCEECGDTWELPRRHNPRRAPGEKLLCTRCRELATGDGVISAEVVAEELEVRAACALCAHVNEGADPIAVRAELAHHLLAEHGVRRALIRYLERDAATIAAPPKGRLL